MLVNRKLVFDIKKDFLNFTPDELENEKYSFDLIGFDGAIEIKNINYIAIKNIWELYKDDSEYRFSKIYENLEIENYRFNPIWELLNE